MLHFNTVASATFALFGWTLIGPVLAASALPAQPKPVSIVMQCGTEPVVVSVDNGGARVVVSGRTLVMKQVPAASGAKYEAAGDPATSYWSRGENGTLVVKG